MTTQYFFIHIVLLVILTFAALIASIGFITAYFSDEYLHPGEVASSKQVKKKHKWAVFSFLFFLLFIGGLSWWIASANEPWRTEYTSLHDIKDVTFPDGSKVQMFTCDNVHHNVTSMFGKIVEINEWQIRRVRWSPFYFGVSYSTLSRTQGDHYFLEHKKGEFPPVKLNPPAEVEDLKED